MKERLYIFSGLSVRYERYVYIIRIFRVCPLSLLLPPDTQRAITYEMSRAIYLAKKTSPYNNNNNSTKISGIIEKNSRSNTKTNRKGSKETDRNKKKAGEEKKTHRD